MSEIRKTFDGGLSENIYSGPEYEQDFMQEKGSEQWIKYRNEWEEYSRLKKEADHPPHLEFELNYSCNLKCPMCTWAMEQAADKKKDWFGFEDYKRLIDEAVAGGTRSIRLCYINEPLIRKDIDHFISYAAGAGILDIIITTNGTLLTREMSRKLIRAGLTKLNVSLDATTAETYDKIRVGGDFEATIRNVHSFLDIRREMNSKLPKLRVTFVRTKINDHEYEGFLDYWKDKADSLGIQHLQNPFGAGRFYDKERGDSIVMDEERQPPERFHCPEPFKRLTLRSNGEVLPCCSFYAVDLVVGNWKLGAIKEIWNNDRMRGLRRIHKDGQYFRDPVCKNCVENYHFVPNE